MNLRARWYSPLSFVSWLELPILMFMSAWLGVGHMWKGIVSWICRTDTKLIKQWSQEDTLLVPSTGQCYKMFILPCFGEIPLQFEHLRDTWRSRSLELFESAKIGLGGSRMNYIQKR